MGPSRSQSGCHGPLMALATPGSTALDAGGECSSPKLQVVVVDSRDDHPATVMLDRG